MKNRVKRFRIVGGLALFVVTAIVATLPLSTLDTYAGEGGGDSGGGVDCYKNGQFVGTLCTKYGAEWRWYATNSDNVIIPGKGKSSGQYYGYAHSTNIVGCAKYGGYWRYAMVAYGSSSLTNGGTYNAGDQVGVTAIGMQYKSEHFGGPMVDRNPGTWQQAEAIYHKLQQTYPSEFYRGWDGSSSLEWFCGGPTLDNIGGGEDPTDPNPPEPTPPPVTDECGKWTPTSYTNSNATSGETSIVVKAKSMEARVAGTEAADWGDGPVYVKPTDEVAWHTCYYGGVPATAHTEVNYVTTNSWRGYDPVHYQTEWPEDQPEETADLHPADEYEDCGNVDGTRGDWQSGTTYNYRMEWQEVWSLVSQTGLWENKFTTDGDGEVIRDGYQIGELSYPYDLKTTGNQTSGKITQEGDAGSTFWERGSTGHPRIVRVYNSSNQTSIYRSACSPVTDYDRPVQVPKSKWHEPEFLGYDEWGNEEWSEGWLEEWEETTYPYKKIRYKCFTCTNKQESGIKYGYIWSTNVSDYAYVRVPYNYENIPGVTINSEFVYSGETVDIDEVWTQTVPKINNVTMDTYATQVPSAKVRLFAYVTADPWGGDVGGTVTSNGVGCSLVDDNVAKQCLELDSAYGLTLNPEGHLEGSWDKHEKFSREYNTLDAAAGDYLCVVSQVYPSTSGEDTNMSRSGDGEWRYSVPTCIIIAKKPTFQVWGSGLYSVGGINAAVGEKRNLYNDYIGNISNFKSKSSVTTNFGSWSEESLILKNGLTATVASGAATGLNTIPSGAGSTGGFCKYRTPLTFANKTCADGGSISNPSSGTGASGIPSGITNREALVDYWIGSEGGSGSVGSNVNLSNPSSIGNEISTPTGVKVRYARASGNVNMYGTVPAGQTYFIKVDGDVTFTGDVFYGGTYSKLSTIPKLVIYANNFNIPCGVHEVDAILIGAGEGENGSSHLDTCSDSPEDVNDPARSQKLRIFGVVMVDSIALKRTYGAATWNESAYPGIRSDGESAEVFDYDSTILMWSEFLGGTPENDTLQTTYQHELAPRF